MRFQGFEHRLEVHIVVGQDAEFQFPGLPLKPPFPVSVAPEAREGETEREAGLAFCVVQFGVLKKLRFDDAASGHDGTTRKGTTPPYPLESCHAGHGGRRDASVSG